MWYMYCTFLRIYRLRWSQVFLFIWFRFILVRLVLLLFIFVLLNFKRRMDIILITNEAEKAIITDDEGMDKDNNERWWSTVFLSLNLRVKGFRVVMGGSCCITRQLPLLKAAPLSGSCTLQDPRCSLQGSSFRGNTTTFYNHFTL